MSSSCTTTMTFVVVDKPVGLAAHPSLGWSGPDVLSHLAGAGFRISTSGVPERRGIVQRLDVGTSGLMVVAKSEHAYTILKRAFRSRSVDKIYHALVQGHPDPFTGTIEAPIGRHPGADYKMAVIDRGRHSVTHYATLEAFVAATLLEIKLETGRTHQIRVSYVCDSASVPWRSDVRGRPGPGGQARARAAVVTRGPAEFRASSIWRADEVRVRVPG